MFHLTSTFPASTLRGTISCIPSLMWWIFKTLSELFEIFFFPPCQFKYYFPNCNFSDQMRETSTRAGVWKGLCYLCKLRPQTTFRLHRGLALSCKGFIRVIFEINSFWYDAEILFENRYISRFGVELLKSMH